jgi:hypothetical protein
MSMLSYEVIGEDLEGQAIQLEDRQMAIKSNLSKFEII